MSSVFLASRFDPAIQFAAVPPPQRELPVDGDFIQVRDFSFFYSGFQALHSVSMAIPNHRITALIGPSGCGKTTLLRSFNRMNDFVPGCRHRGDISIAGDNIFDRKTSLMNLRRSVGLVFQRPNPLPCSIYENIACAVRTTGEARGSAIAEHVERNLVRVGLWDEVKDRLHQNALTLSGGQMQLLCIARALACRPQVLLLDEPCSSLDLVATTRIENLIIELSRHLTIVLVTHNFGQAARCSDYIGFFLEGRLVEFGESSRMFVRPRDPRTLDYLGSPVRGRFGFAS